MHEIVNSSASSNSIECPKLIHKSSRNSFERKHYTPVRLEKKFDEYERRNHGKVENNEKRPTTKQVCKSLK